LASDSVFKVNRDTDYLAPLRQRISMSGWSPLVKRARLYRVFFENRPSNETGSPRSCRCLRFQSPVLFAVSRGPAKRLLFVLLGDPCLANVETQGKRE